jgi:hypothetical protein
MPKILGHANSQRDDQEIRSSKLKKQHAMELKPGSRLRSATDTTEVVVVRTPAESVDLRCGGHPMLPIDADNLEAVDIEPGFGGGTQLGKRYASEEAGIELLCTKAGGAAISLGTELLGLKSAKPLPSSD